MSHTATLRTLIAAALAIASCSKEPEYTGEQRACIAQHYGKYDSKDMNQCVAVCKDCMNGTSTTCTTSCKLRGAS
jgi:hypothetical protein